MASSLTNPTYPALIFLLLRCIIEQWWRQQQEQVWLCLKRQKHNWSSYLVASTDLSETIDDWTCLVCGFISPKTFVYTNIVLTRIGLGVSEKLFASEITILAVNVFRSNITNHETCSSQCSRKLRSHSRKLKKTYSYAIIHKLFFISCTINW